jgi:molybdopterin converting factor small subunit
MAVVLLPSLLAREAGGEGRFETDASSVRDALEGLPIADLLFDERGTLRPLVNVYVNREQVEGVDVEIGSDDEVRLVAAVAGG